MRPLPRRAAVAATIITVGAAVLAGGIVSANAATAATPQDLLAGRDWSHLTGATVTSAGVHITPVGRLIVEQDGSGGQPNPPVNIRGPYLDVSGNFQVTATMQVNSGTPEQSIRLYGQTPVIYDEWRQERPSVQVGITAGKLKVDVWNGKSDKPTLSKTYGSGLSGTVTVVTAHTGSNLVFSANGKTLATTADSSVFSSGHVWFGADAANGSAGWTLTGLTAEAVGSGTVAVHNAPALAQGTPPSDSLRTLASKLDRPILMGTAIAVHPLFTDGTYRQIAGQQYSMLTPENDMKPQFVHPQPNVYTFDEADALVDFANANGMKVHAHTLVWQEALPAWMRASMSNDQRKQVMLTHIDNVAGHFAGRVAEWDVINEPMSDEDKDYTNGHKGLRPDLWFNAMGENYITLALNEAHKIDPHAKLFINEYGVEEAGNRWDAFYALLKRLKAAGVPLDGVGFQNHEYEAGDRTPIATFKDHVEKVQALGLQWRVSEMDVLASASIQSKEFSDKLTLCVNEPGCSSFSTWGFTDKYGSTADINHYPPSPGDALPYDKNIKPKPAYTAIQKALH